ncbi:MAG: DUF5702 domain-containing protein [Clostridiales bacterium]|nr:DUF5702 domain-containing protein [Clostridiales bacterium]
MKKRGSITLFTALLLTCFFSAVFAFLEASRVSGLVQNSRVSTMQAADTVMASYQRQLWEAYHLLFWEAPEGDLPGLEGLKDLQVDAVEGNLTDSGLRENYYMLQVHLTEITTTSYQLATDDGGAAFREQSAEMMRLSLGEEAVDSMLSWITGDVREEEEDLATEALDALETLESAQKAKEEASGAGESGSEETDSTGSNTDSGNESGSGSGADSGSDAGSESVNVEITENPLEWVRKMQKSGILAFLMSSKSISQKTIDCSACIENRTLESGTLSVSYNSSNTEKLFFHLYLDRYFTDATETASDHVLDYELEYMIAGRADDQENLKVVARRLLLMREGMNLVYLETDAKKQQEAAAAALVLCSAVGLPELEPVVKQGVLAAWAYAESLSDVRILLEGGKVSLVKTADQWHTEIGSLSSGIYAVDGKEQTKGLSYANYLQILMWTTSDEKLAQRAMDMIEKNTDVRMDQMICRAECEYVYEASPLFWNLVTLGQHSFGTYCFRDQAGISFLGSE